MYFYINVINQLYIEIIKQKQIQFVQYINSVITIEDYYYIHEDVRLNDITCL